VGPGTIGAGGIVGGRFFSVRNWRNGVAALHRPFYLLAAGPMLPVLRA